MVFDVSIIFKGSDMEKCSEFSLAHMEMSYVLASMLVDSTGVQRRDQN